MTADDERSMTIRNAIRAVLEQGPHTAREISELVHISERDVVDHLSQLLRARDHGIRIVPARCIACGFTFEGRTRTSRPGRCPKCRSTRIAPPEFCLRAERS